MAITNYAGYWTGSILGTNQGGFAADLSQDGNKIVGTAKIGEPTAQYEYQVFGTVADDMSLVMRPIARSTAYMQLGEVKVLCRMDADGKLAGRWKSTVGTEGTLTASRFEQTTLGPDLPKMNSVFLVHGHDEGVMHSVARFLSQLGVNPVILQEQINRGMTVIEKFEEFAARAGFAIVLMTPDDIGYPSGREEEKKSRPRQNVILELGYFAARLGREKTFVLVKGDMELPSDVLGLVYEVIDKSEGWKMKLAKELKVAGFEIDMNRVIS